MDQLHVGDEVIWQLRHGDPLTSTLNGGVGTITILTPTRVTLRVVRFPHGSFESLTFDLDDIELTPRATGCR